MKVFISLGLLVLVSLTTVMAVDQRGDQLQTLSNKGTQVCSYESGGAKRLTAETKFNCSEDYEAKRRLGFRTRTKSE